MTQNFNYKDFEKMIFKLAHKWANRSYVEFEEFVSTGNLALCVAHKNFNADRGAKFSSYAYACINNAMNDAAMKAYRISNTETFAETDNDFVCSHFESPEKRVALKQWFDNLSKESRFIIGIIFETPMEIINMARRESYAPKNTMDRTYRHLRNQGWKHKDISDCFAEIKGALREDWKVK